MAFSLVGFFLYADKEQTKRESVLEKRGLFAGLSGFRLNIQLMQGNELFFSKCLKFCSALGWRHLG